MSCHRWPSARVGAVCTLDLRAATVACVVAVFALCAASTAAARLAGPIALQSHTGHFIVAEGGGGADANANRGAIGEWERFHVIPAGDGTVALETSNGRYLSAAGGAAVANAAAIGDWERFTVVDQADGTVALRAFDGRFVVAEGGGGGALNANRGAVGAWERFTIVPIDPATLPVEQIVTIRTHNGHYVVAEGDGSGRANANRPAVGDWETFTQLTFADGTVAFRSVHGTYLNAPGAGGGGLDAQALSAGAWERFTLVDNGDGTTAIRTANGHFVVAEGGGGGDLNANRGAVGAWERFVIEPVERRVAEVLLGAAEVSLELGDAVDLVAAARDADGRTVRGVPRVVLPINAGLSVDARGRLRANAPGAWPVQVAIDGVLSEPLLIGVVDPRERVLHALTGRVELPSGLPADAVRVVGPGGERVALDQAGRFTLLTKRYHNQIVRVVDAAERTVLIGVVPGERDGVAPEDVVIDLGSTAEAMTFLTPAFLHDSPAVLAGFRNMARDLPAAEEVERVVRQAWLDAGDPFADAAGLRGAVGALSRDVVARAEAVIAARPQPAPIAPALAQAGGDDLPFEPKVTPGFASGITAKITGQGAWTVDIEFANTLLRRVDLYVEAVDADAPFGRGQLVGRRLLGTVTGLPSTGKLIAAGFDDDNTIAGQFFSAASTNIPFDFRTADAFRVYAYGPGLQGPNLPESAHPQALTDARIISPLARTYVFDYVGSAVALLTTLPKGVIVEPLSNLLERINNILSAGGATAMSLRRFLQGDTDLDGAGVIVDLALGFAIDLAEKLAANVAAEAFEKLTIVLDIYGIIVNGSQLAALAVSVATAHTVEGFTVFNSAAKLQPPLLPSGEIGCPYEAELTVNGSAAEFHWSFERGPAGLRFKGPPTGRTVTIELPEVTAVTRSFTMRVERREPTANGHRVEEVISKDYYITPVPAGPRIASVRFPFNPTGRMNPGDFVDVRVTATHCKGAAAITGGGYAGGAVKGGALVLGAISADGKTRTLTGKVEAKDIMQDKVVVANQEQVKFTVRAGAKTATKNKAVDILNVAPQLLPPTAIRVAPGEPLPLRIDGFDENWDDSATEIFPGRGRVRASRGQGNLLLAGNLSFPIDTFKPDPLARKPLTGDFGFELMGPVRVKSEHLDNDNPGDPLIDIRLRVLDDNGEEGSIVVPVVVTNVAPKVGPIQFDPPVLPDLNTVGSRPLVIRAAVTDENTLADIRAVKVDVSRLGLGAQLVSMQLTNDGVTWEAHLPDVKANCAAVACTVEVIAFDRDDPVTGSNTKQIMQRNEPPEVRADGVLNFRPVGRSICVGSPLRFAVHAVDPNNSPLKATLILDGNPYAMRRLVGTDTFVLDRRATFVGVHTYHYVVEEIGTVGQRFSARSNDHTYRVDDCDVEGDQFGCDPESGTPEVCDGIDNDCDNAVDEGLEPCSVLHAGDFRAERAPVCRGDAVRFEVSVSGGPAFPVQVELTSGAGSFVYDLDPIPNNGFDGGAGRYAATVPAPDRPGDYAVRFLVPGAELRMQYGLRIEDCCAGATGAAPIVIGRGGVLGDTREVVTIIDADGVRRIDPAICEEEQVVIEGGADLVVGDAAELGWIREGRAFVRDFETGEVIPIEGAGIATELAVAAGRVLITEDRGRVAILRLVDLREKQSFALADGRAGARFSPRFVDGVAWFIADGVPMRAEGAEAVPLRHLAGAIALSDELVVVEGEEGFDLRTFDGERWMSGLQPLIGTPLISATHIAWIGPEGIEVHSRDGEGRWTIPAEVETVDVRLIGDQLVWSDGERILRLHLTATN